MTISAFDLELRSQRQRAVEQLETALRADDGFMAELAMARITELDELAANHGVDLAS